MKSYAFFKDSLSKCEQIDLTVKKNIAFYAVGFLITTLQLHQVVFQSFVTPARCDNLGRCLPQFISIVRDGIYIMDLLYIITTSFLLQIFICNICLYSTFLVIFLRPYFWKRVPFLHAVNYKSVRWEPFYVDWLRRQNLKTLRVRKCRDEMENRDAHIVILIFVYILSCEMGFSLESLRHTNVMINIFLPTHNVRLTFCVTKWVWTSLLKPV